VYEELRRLAARKLAREKAGQTLDATSLVHEAYLRLVGSGENESGEQSAANKRQWNSRGHFFAAAAEAMRRILIEQARRKRRSKHGGDRRRVDLDEAACLSGEPGPDLLALDEVLSRLAETDATAAKLVELRYFAGLSMPEAAASLGLSLRSAERNWTYARTWLHRELAQEEGAAGREQRS
jgi:RNA polymerase sigma factor (TIGR02999 family)